MDELKELIAKLIKTQEGGNNQTPSSSTEKESFRSRAYVFTLNNYDENSVNSINSYLSTMSERFIFGKEVGGKSEIPHLQGFMRFSSQKYWNLIVEECPAFARAWSAKAKGNLKSNVKYCAKQEGEIFYKGFAMEKILYKVTIDLRKWQKKIKKVLDQEPDDRSIVWLWESRGGAGKTTFQKWIFQNYKNVIILNGKGADMRNGIIEYEKKNGDTPDIVLINVPRSVDSSYISFEGIESVKDMFFYSGKYEGGMICGKSPHVIIFSNEQPNAGKMSLDRWLIYEIVGDVLVETVPLVKRT